jgi:hypothetical protein
MSRVEGERAEREGPNNGSLKRDGKQTNAEKAENGENRLP